MLEAQPEELAARCLDVLAQGGVAIAQVGGEMVRVAEAMEARLGRTEKTQSEALERLSSELGRITDRLSGRIAGKTATGTIEQHATQGSCETSPLSWVARRR